NGSAQKNGGNYKASDVTSRRNCFSLNIAGAYPKEAGVEKWIRSYELRNNQVLIDDHFTMKEAKAPNMINFMSWGKIEKKGKGQIVIQVNDVKALLMYDEQLFDVSLEPIKLDDRQLQKVWGNQVCRISLKAKQIQPSGNYHFVLKKL
ncbi:MAG: heparinase, partial [Phocaeicola sp.]|nr:heparinase [Phocaeicola sp.]